jgi:hypothetical protein
MANDEHVAMLKRGVAAWNAWRDENDHICPNLARTLKRYDARRGCDRFVVFSFSLAAVIRRARDVRGAAEHCRRRSPVHCVIGRKNVLQRRGHVVSYWFQTSYSRHS